ALEKQDFDRALVCLNREIRARPSYAWTHANRGVAHFGKGAYDLAIRDYTQAIRLRPTNPLFHFNRGLVHASKGDHAQALADYTEAVRLKTSSSWGKRTWRGFAPPAQWPKSATGPRPWSMRPGPVS